MTRIPAREVARRHLHAGSHVTNYRDGGTSNPCVAGAVRKLRNVLEPLGHDVHAKGEQVVVDGFTMNPWHPLLPILLDMAELCLSS